MIIYPEYRDFIPSPLGGVPLLVPTSKDIEGPFYKPGAPLLEDGKLCDHPTFILRGRVTDKHGEPIAFTVLDFWQADEMGVYDNTGFKLRGKITADAEGKYEMHTVIPGCYEIGENEFRCQHLHVKVGKLTTQLYFPGAAHNDTDHWFDQSRVVRIASRSGDRALFDFVLEEELS